MSHKTGDMSPAGIEAGNVSDSPLFVERAASSTEGGQP